MRTIGNHWPAAAALLLLYAVLGACLAAALERNDGHFTYVLDDPYIHMAWAKNLAEHGVAGVTRYAYSSSSSSIGWPLLLASTYLVSGTNALAPLVLNVLCATAVVWLAYVLLSRQGISPWLNFGCLSMIAFCTPLPAIVFTGMEHTLHVLLAMAFLYLAAKSVSRPEKGTGPICAKHPKGRSGKLDLSPFPPPGDGREAQQASPESKLWRRAATACYFALPALITMTRYEGALMIGVVCLLLAIRRRIWEAVALGLLGAAPVVVNGLVAVSKGWHFLPNPVLLKGRTPSGFSFDQILDGLRLTALTMIRQPHVPAMIAATLLLLVLLHRMAESEIVGGDSAGDAMAPDFSRRRSRLPQTTAKTMLWTVLATAILHVQLAKIGWFFRYEAYLMACGLLAVFMVTAGGVREYFRGAAVWKRAAACCTAGMLALPLLHHGGRSLALIPPATTLIYQQQYQMAAFLNRYYAGQAVAANDIGAINYYADVRNLDLWGLGSLDVADARLQNRYGPEEIRWLSAQHGVKVAMVFTDWFDEHYGGLPPNWREVGQWEIAAIGGSRNYVVSFYAVDPGETDALAENLREFSSQLPQSVVQRGFYLDAGRPSARVAARDR